MFVADSRDDRYAIRIITGWVEGQTGSAAVVRGSAGQDARSPEQDGPTVKLPIAEVPVSLLKASIAVRALPVCNVGMGSAAATQPISSIASRMTH